MSRRGEGEEDREANQLRDDFLHMRSLLLGNMGAMDGRGAITDGPRKLRSGTRGPPDPGRTLEDVILDVVDYQQRSLAGDSFGRGILRFLARFVTRAKVIPEPSTLLAHLADQATRLGSGRDMVEMADQGGAFGAVEERG